MEKKNHFFVLMLLCLSLGISLKSTAQTKGPKLVMTDVSKEQANAIDFESEDNDHPYDGTFQLICSKNGSSKELFTADYLLPFIEKNREVSIEKIIQLSPNTKLRILSKNQIASPNFQPFKKLYSFE